MNDIFKPLINDEHFEKMFKCDDDLSRLIAPIAASIVYIYLISRDIEETINIFLNIDIIGIHFFVISYSILDNLMDDINESSYDKAIFFKWFMNIVNSPSNEITMDDAEQNIWQCTTFKKYFTMFVNKYPVKQNMILYDFVKILISTMNKANNIQKNIDSSDEEVLEYSFKKSYVVSFFTVLMINAQTNNLENRITKQNINIACRLLFLIQIYDDFTDIDKDFIEQNYTYFNPIKNKNCIHYI